MFSFDIDPAQRRIEGRLSGELKSHDLLAALEEVVSDPLFDPAYDALIDGTEILRMPPVHEIREVAQTIRRLAKVPGARRAIVTSSQAFYSLAKLFKAMTVGAVSRYRVFTTVADAESWLTAPPGVDDDDDDDVFDDSA
jgi:hypothetical protein